MFKQMKNKFRQMLGVFFYDWRKYSNAFKSKNPDWIRLCNRIEKVTPAPDGIGVNCNWKWSSELHAPKIYPSLGLRLMKRAFDDYPVVLESYQSKSELPSNPYVSFIIGHRGMERLSNLLLTLKSIAAQIGVTTECIVVEQSFRKEAQRHLPDWVRYIHSKLPVYDMPFSRSWAFNVGARHAQGDLLIFHDNDLIAPTDYAIECYSKFKDGYFFIDLKRFIFYLPELSTRRFTETGIMPNRATPVKIKQNAAGGSVAVSRNTFFEIGGFDEEFIGWGGEDNEFRDRALTQNAYVYGYIPMLHLWHPPQQIDKGVYGNNFTMTVDLKRRRKIDLQLRIDELRKRKFGNLDGTLLPISKANQNIRKS